MLPTSNRLQIDFEQVLQLANNCLHIVLACARKKTQGGAGVCNGKCLKTRASA